MVNAARQNCCPASFAAQPRHPSSRRCVCGAAPGKDARPDEDKAFQIKPNNRRQSVEKATGDSSNLLTALSGAHHQLQCLSTHIMSPASHQACLCCCVHGSVAGPVRAQQEHHSTRLQSELLCCPSGAQLQTHIWMHVMRAPTPQHGGARVDLGRGGPSSKRQTAHTSYAQHVRDHVRLLQSCPRAGRSPTRLQQCSVQTRCLGRCDNHSILMAACALIWATIIMLI